ncbi:MAG: F0F1 ATP synthase subunit gamma [Lentisphaerae bacterium ADurb.BinA184]|nr:MAG: F0F1 ATP synthase subunit gamma [Lentisphaerae bacterium ADurb.BinA184]
MYVLQELKSELRINGELTEIVDALKVIAVTEFWSLEAHRRERFSRFLAAFEGFFQMLDFSTIEHPFARDTSGRLSLLILTSDERFMGGLNQEVVDTALAQAGAGAADLIVVGQQGADYLRTLGRRFERLPETITSRRPYEAANLARQHILAMAAERGAGRLLVVYPKPVSFLVQTVKTLPLLPCTELISLEKRELGKREAVLTPRTQVLVDSSPEALVQYLVDTWIAEKLLEVFEDSRQAELSARAVRLEESYQGLQDNRKKLVHSYHKTHHEALDKGMRDTFSAQVMRRR